MASRSASPAPRAPRWRLALAAAAVAASSVPAAAQAGLTVHQTARLRAVLDSAIAPDGSAIAVTRSVPRDPLRQPDGAPWVELHVVTPDGRERGYVTGEVNVAAPAWTPDGSAVTFLARRSGDTARAVYRIPKDGGEARRVVSHATDIGEYAWRPDGRAIAFVAAEAGSPAERALDAKGFTQRVYEERVKPMRLWIADLASDGSASTARRLPVAGSVARLRWSPAGDRLSAHVAPSALVDDSYMKMRLHVLDASTGRTLARFENPGKIGDVRWSPDGRHLAVVSAADPNDPLEGRLVILPSTGGPWPAGDTLGAFMEHGHVTAVGWENADTVVWLADEGVGATIGRVGADGSGAERVFTSTATIARSFSVARTGALALVADAPEHPAEAFMLSPGARAPMRLTHTNGWLADVPLARQDVVRYKARDGLELDGVLVRPLGEQSGQRYPLIVVVHGGPEAHYANGWLTGYTMPGQAAAARGFAVFYPNYRGSTGRGVAFSKLGQGDPAGREFDDLVDGVDHLVNIGLVDAARVGITGGSYGGYASAWGATFYSHRFAASVMFVGISNTISKMGTSDIPYELHMVHYRRWPWDDWQRFLERSPIYHVDKARTPLLILHGEDDPRVPPSQSMELYRHLKLRTKTPVRLVLYPGEGHGNRRAASRLDYHLRLMQWMDHYLKGPGGDMPSAEIAYEEPD
jgi:dipeptidyl aminopeptidase/acylaminoacyl peptidase